MLAKIKTWLRRKRTVHYVDNRGYSAVELKFKNDDIVQLTNVVCIVLFKNGCLFYYTENGSKFVVQNKSDLVYVSHLPK